MSRDWTLYLEDIADACRLIEEFTAGMSAKSFAGTVTEKTHPGHGRMKEVHARAKAIKLEALVA